MSRLFYAFFVLLLFGQMPVLQAQLSCDDQRYRDPVFSAQRTASNLSYGNAPALAGLCLSEWWTSSQNLKLDVYEPIGDTVSQRPCLVYAHGGAFAIGEKRMVPVESYCLAMAERGYVVVSLDYRKCFNALSYGSTVRAVYRAVQDMNAAIRFVRENAGTFGVDTNLVFAGGNSAGGFMALHAAYAEEDERATGLGPTYDWPNLGTLSSSGNSFNRSGRPDAVVNLWGALFDTAWIEAGDVPLFSVHGGIDALVFPGYWPPFSWPVFPAVYGSVPIHERANNLGLTAELHLLPFEGHEPWLLSVLAPFWFDEIVGWSSAFLYQNLLAPQTGAISGPNPACSGSTQTYTVPASPGSTYCWSVDGGDILSSSGNSVTVSWTSSGSGTLGVQERNANAAWGELITLDVSVTGTCCTTPVAPGSSSITPTSATLSWTGAPGASEYRLQGGPLGGPYRQGILPGSVSTRSISGLVPGTSYEWWVQSRCGADTSSTVGPLTFSTPLARNSASASRKDALVVFPNPGRGIAHLACGNWPTGAKQANIYSSTGQQILSLPITIKGSLAKLDTRSAALPAGLYRIVVQGTERSIGSAWHVE